MTFIERLGSQHMPEDRQRGGRSAHMRGQRAGRVGTAFGRIEQRDIGVVERVEFGGQRVRAIHQHAVQEAGQGGFHRRFPTGFDLQRFTQATGLVQPEPGQPTAGSAFLLAERSMLQRFQ